MAKLSTTRSSPVFLVRLHGEKRRTRFLFSLSPYGFKKASQEARVFLSPARPVP